MPTSIISSIDFHNVWKVGDSITFQSPTTTDSEEPFLYAVVLDPVTPQTEKTIVYVQPQGIPGTDNGVIFGGNFKPVISQIEVTGNLTDSQKAVIRANISPLVSPGQNDEDAFTFNVTPIARSGAEFFQIVIPYKEQIVINNSPLIDIGFIQMNGSNSLYNPTLVTVDRVNNQVVIDGGFDTHDVPCFRVTNISSGRTLTAAGVEKSDGLFSLNWSEDLTGRTLLNIDNNNPIEGCQIQYFGSRILDTMYTYTASVSGDILSVTVDEEVVSANFSSNTYLQEGPMLYMYASHGLEITLTFSGRSNLNLSYRMPSDTPASVRRVDVLEFSRNGSASFGTSVTVSYSATEVSATGQYLSSTGQILTFNESLEYGVGVSNISALYVKTQQLFSTIHSLYGIGILVRFPLPYSYNGSGQPISHHASGDEVGSLPISLINTGPIVVQTIDFESQINPALTLTLPIQDTPLTADIDVSYDSGSTVSTMITAIREAILPYFVGFPAYVPGGSSIAAGSGCTMAQTPAACFNAQSMSFQGWTFLPIIGSPKVNTYDARVINAGGVYRSQTHTFATSDYLTYDAYADAIARAFEDQFIQCTSGLHYGSFLPSSSMPTSGSWTANSIFSSPPLVNITAASGAIVSGSYSKTLDGSTTIAGLMADFNTALAGLFQSDIMNSVSSPLDANNLVDFGPVSIPSLGASTIFDIPVQTPVIEEYRFSDHLTLASLVTAINADWTDRGLTASVFSDTQSYVADSITANLNDINGVNVFDSSWLLFGKVHSIVSPDIPEYDIAFDFDVRFATTGSGGGNAGIQIAFGGYEKDGELILNTAPNTFEEPGFNTFFPVNFQVSEVQKVFLLLRTRQNLDGNLFSSRESDYAAVVRYFNGFPSQSLPPLIQNTEPFVSSWTETNIGDPSVPQVPIALCVPMAGPKVEVIIDDVSVRDSINVTIENVPDAIDEFGFLAINRTSSINGMSQSKQGRVFGLVLDNRGIWDILIAPEAEMQKVISGGSFSYLGSWYSRYSSTADEGYDFSFINDASLPPEVRGGISLIPAPGYPQVWVLRIERSVKEYLLKQRAGSKKNTKDGCSIDIDMQAIGRTTGIPGTCRVTVYADVYCVFDINLCDSYWNLKEPPIPSGPELIANRLEFAYQSLIDCNHLETTSSNGITIVSVPIMLHAENVPMFKNGNALLLVKTSYSAEIQSFYSPTGVDLQGLQFEDCSTVANNIPLSIRLNKPLLYLPNNPTPITDPIQIDQLLQTEASYMLVKPSFQYPASDPKKDCGANEIVIVGLGYQFKNWRNGVREDDILFGVQMSVPNNSFVLPQLNLCYRYYYNQKES